jgi:hypothetical protein
LAVLKIKYGCEAKQGGTDFPEVAMERLGLKEATACKLLRIGQEAEKLLRIRKSLPGSSMVTLYQIARMEPDVIDDKIERGVIHPNATEHQVIEKPRPKRVEVQVNHDDTELAKDFAGVLAKLKPDEQKILRKQYDSDMRAAVNNQLKEIRKEREQIDKARTELKRARRQVQDPFTQEEFRKIRAMLHPDRHPGNEQKAKEAFNLFVRIEPICKKVKLQSV